MQLRMYTDYALRVLLFVGAHPGDPVPASAIAHAYGISVDHVAKAAKALTRAGLLRATRGAGGGVELAQSPSEVCIGRVVRLFEGGPDLVECFSGTGACKIERACGLRHAFVDAENAFFAQLDRYTLADVLANAPQLLRLLSPARRAAVQATPLRPAPDRRSSTHRAKGFVNAKHR